MSAREAPVVWPEDEWPALENLAVSGKMGAAIHGWRLLSWHFGDGRSFWLMAMIHELGPERGGRFPLLAACIATADLVEGSPDWQRSPRRSRWVSVLALLGVEPVDPSLR